MIFTSVTTTNSTSTSYYSAPTASSSVIGTTLYTQNPSFAVMSAVPATLPYMNNIEPQLTVGTYALPDGAKLTIRSDLNYAIEDKDAVITYAASRHRPFNQFVNVSDVLDQFMKYAADMDLTRQQFLGLPIQTFLMWLVIEAAKRDGEVPPADDLRQLELAISA